MSKMPMSSVPPSAEKAPQDRSRQSSLSPAHEPPSQHMLEATWERLYSQVGQESATRALMLAPVSVRVIST